MKDLIQCKKILVNSFSEFKLLNHCSSDFCGSNSPSILERSLFSSSGSRSNSPESDASSCSNVDGNLSVILVSKAYLPQLENKCAVAAELFVSERHPGPEFSQRRGRFVEPSQLTSNPGPQVLAAPFRSPGLAFALVLHTRKFGTLTRLYVCGLLWCF